MRSTSPRRILLVAVLLLLTATPWAVAGPRPGSGHRVSISGELVIPEFLSRAWSWLTGIWTKEDCNIDPDGRCQPASAPASSPLPNKEGCHIDPNGRCLPAVVSPSNAGDEGCNIDPSGSRCNS